MSRIIGTREQNRIAYAGVIEHTKSRPPPMECTPAFVEMVRREIAEADRNVRMELLRESVQVEGRKPDLSAREPVRKPSGLTLTRTAELWLKAIGHCHFVSTNVPSARSIMYQAAKKAGLTIRTHHDGHGLVTAEVVGPLTSD